MDEPGDICRSMVDELWERRVDEILMISRYLHCIRKKNRDNLFLNDSCGQINYFIIDDFLVNSMDVPRKIFDYTLEIIHKKL